MLNTRSVSKNYLREIGYGTVRYGKGNRNVTEINMLIELTFGFSDPCYLTSGRVLAVHCFSQV